MAERKILQLLKSRKQGVDRGSLSPELTQGSLSQEQSFNTLTNDVAHLKQSLTILQNILQSLNQQFVNLEGRVEKQEQASGRKNDNVEKSEELAAAIKIGAASSAELVNQISAGSESLHHQRFNAEAALKATDEEKSEVHIAALEARVAAVEALIVSKPGRVEAHKAASIPSEKAAHESFPHNQSVREAQKRPDEMAPQPSDVTLDLDSKAKQPSALFMFEPSAWESAIFIGLIGAANLQGLSQVAPVVIGSVMLCIALIANISIQLLLTVIIDRSFPSSPLNLEAMLQWRHFTGHHISQVDAFGHSLVSNVCESHPTLSVATSQDGILESSRTYMNANFDGPALCVIVIMIHCTFWLKDTERTLTIIKQLWHIPVSATTRISPSNDGTLSLESLHLARKLFMYLVCLTRLSVATMLLVRGTLWLVYTISITELVLNAVALEFVFDLDELLFDICATRQVSLMVELTRRQASGATLPLGTLAPLRASTLVAFAVAMFCVYVHPNTLVLRGILAATCDGEKDFAVARHQDLDVVFYVSTHPSSAGRDMKDNELGRVTEGIIRSEIVAAAKLPDLGQMSSLLAMGATAVADATMVHCADSSLYHLPRLWQLMQQDFNLTGDWSCENVSKACGSPSSHLVRMLCPETCRCYFSKPSIAISKGCPFWKCQDNAATAGYYDESLSCTDESVESLVKNIYWQSFWESFSAYSSHASGSLEGSPDYSYWQLFLGILNSFNGSAAVGEVVDYAMKFGCSVISKYRLFDIFCAQVTDRHSLGTFCPESCDCENQDIWGCPTHCMDS